MYREAVSKTEKTASDKNCGILRPLAFLWKLRGEIRHYRGRLFFLSLLTAGLSTSSLVTPQLTRWIIDVAYPARNLHLFWLLSAAMVVINVVSAAIQAVHGYLSTYVNNLIGFRTRMRVFQALSRVSVAYVERHNTGMFLERCSNDADVTAGMLADIIPQAASLILTTAITITLMLRISIKVTALVIICAPIYCAVNIILAAKMRNWEKSMRSKAEQLATLTVEVVEGVPTAKLLGAQKWLRTNYKKLLRDKIIIAFGMWRTQLTYGRIGWAVTYGWGVVLTCGVWYLVFKDRLLLGQAVALGMYIPLLLRPADAAVGIYKSLMSASVSAQRIDEVIKAAYNHKAQDGGRFAASTLKNLRLNNVTFAYNDRLPCLRNVSLNFKAGQTTVILGQTGSGKTTILKLMAGFYDSYKGSITIDEQNLYDVKQEDYQSNVAMVMSENFFFSGTIIENMLLAKNDVSRKDVYNAVKIMGIEQLISELPKGYDTQLGAGGVRLSSGQVQKLALVRALLRRPRLLLLDEVTSAMDLKSERKVLNGIRELCPAGCITVMTTHRLAITLETWVDRIVILADGEVIEDGAVQELYSRNGEYASLINLSGLGTSRQILL